jgi:hypothetical protein
MKTLYLDESGVAKGRPDPTYPIFVLGGVIIDSDDLSFNNNLVNAFKIKYFGTTDIILHSSDIIRQRNGFELLKNPNIWNDFLSDINELIRKLKFSVIACVVKSENYDSYNFAIIEVSKLFAEICPCSGNIIIESTGKPQDARTLLTFGGLNIESLNLEIQPKSKNIIGLQIADLILSPLARHYLGKQDNQDYEIISTKCEINGIIIV